MKITEINIKCFGKLKNFTLRPIDGVNIIFGENESGKTTVMAFLKAMFYGQGNGEKRRQYEPWEGGQPGGSVEFENDDGKTYLLTRTFGATKAEDKISLLNKTLNEPVVIPAGQEPGTLVLGMNVKTFVNTLFIGQAGTTIEGENSEIVEKLINLASAGDEHISKGDVEKRLKNAASAIDSKKASAILPELHKQRHELLESRSEMQNAIVESDRLRDEIAVAYKRRSSLTKERDFLTDISNRLQKQAELSEIDEILAARDKVTELEAQFAELDKLFSGQQGEQMTGFLEGAKQLIEEEKAKQIVIEEKQKQFDELKKTSETIDRNKLAMTKVANKYPKEIMSAFERYDTLMSEKNEVELVLEVGEQEKAQSKDIWRIAGLCLAVLLLTFIAGTYGHWLFYVVGVVAIASVIAYFVVYKRGANAEGFNSERVELNNINEDLRTLNAEMRPIFEHFHVKNMEEFDSAYKEIERVQKQYIEYRTKKAAFRKELDGLMDELDDIRAKLRESLSAYYPVDSNDEAFHIISRLDDTKERYDRLAAELTAARDTYRFMCKGRDIDALEERGRQLRGDINLEIPDNFTPEKINGKLKITEEKLNELNQQIVRQETELSLRPYSEQDVVGVTDEIKNLTKRMEHYNLELEALEEAQATLTEAFEEMQLDFGPMINYRAKRILGGMTEEKYNSVFVSEKLVPTVIQTGTDEPRSCEVLSAGTYDQIYLSLRLALSGLMADEKMPVLLDDSFAQFDDNRMEKALAFIGSDNAVGELGQVIIFTCHKRMLLAAKRLNMIDGVFSMEQG